MSYPMLGDGIDSYKRVRPDWNMCEQILTLMTSPDVPDTKRATRDSIEVIFRTLVDEAVEKSSYASAFTLPHGGHKWGNHFKPMRFRCLRSKRVKALTFVPYKDKRKRLI